MIDTQIKEMIDSLGHKGVFVWPESDYGKAEIWKINDVYILFEIPMYGGKPTYSGTFYNSKDIFNRVRNWT